MFTTNEMIAIGEWVKRKFVGSFYFSFAQSFKDQYIIVEPYNGQFEGRQVYKIEEIMKDLRPEG